MKKLIQQKSSSHKIALYIRVSTEEQASNPEGSIKSQEQRLRQSVEFRNLEGNFGEVVAVYVDRAKSGKDTCIRGSAYAESSEEDPRCCEYGEMRRTESFTRWVKPSSPSALESSFQMPF